MFYVHRSNRLERLVDELAVVVGDGQPGPTEREPIVVAGPGMDRWVSLELAQRLGVWANPHFPRPQHFLDDVLVAVLGPPAPGALAFTRDSLLWALAATLPDLWQQPAFAPLHAGSPEVPGSKNPWRVATALADTFDAYAVYRPDDVLRWEATEASAGNEWAAILWRALVKRYGTASLAARGRDLVRSLSRRQAPPEGLPRRVSCFGLRGVPPLFLELFAALSAWMDVHWFVVSPSREHWAEIRSKREIARTLRRQAGATPAELALSEGNPLLASLGRIARDDQFLLEGAIDYVDTERDLYVENTETNASSLLATLQDDMLALRHRHIGNPDASPRTVALCDRSVSVHGCAGALREVEVLRQELLAALEENPTLGPHDVIILTPDLATYAPLVEAVFAVDPQTPDFLPLRVAGRNLALERPAIAAFFALLDLVESRVTARAVLDLLARDSVRTRFAIDVEELPTFRRWLIEANVRWGIDGAHRAEFGQPPFEESTWRFGLDRLLLGYAMPLKAHESVDGCLPAGGVGGDDGELLGRFAEFCERLFDVCRSLRGEHLVDEWQARLTSAMDQLLRVSAAYDDELQPLRSALADLAEEAHGAGFHGTLSLAALTPPIRAKVRQADRGSGLLTGSVTVSALGALRNVPFPVVALLGLNDGVIPQRSLVRPFDDLLHPPRRGDHDPRDEDRARFLEAISAARTRLIVTYTDRVGRAEAPPSVLIGELLDVLDESFFCSGGDPSAGVRAHVLRRHPLHSCSPMSFQSSSSVAMRVAGDMEHVYRGAEALAGDRTLRPRWLAAPLSNETSEDVSLDELGAFLRNPAQALLHGRLGLWLRDQENDVVDRETTELAGLDAYRWHEELLRRARAGENLTRSFADIYAGGGLPLGNVGRCYHEEHQRQALALAAALHRYTSGTRADSLSFRIPVGGAFLVGHLTDLWPKAQVHCRSGRPKAAAELDLWVRHLAWQLAGSAEGPRPSVALAYDRSKKQVRVVTFAPVADPQTILHDLLTLYRWGRQIPLRFFPAAGFSYMEILTREGPEGEGKALLKAREVFAPAFVSGAPPEAADPFVAFLFAHEDPLDPNEARDGAPTFSELCQRILSPLFNYRTERIEAPYGDP